MGRQDGGENCCEIATAKLVAAWSVLVNGNHFRTIRLDVKFMNFEHREMKSAAELWPDSKAILLPYEDMASQLYVLDLPLKILECVLDKLSEKVSCPNVATFGSEDSVPLNSEIRKEIVSCSEETGPHVLSGDWLPGRRLSVWLWKEASCATFDAEFVFWADLEAV